MLTSQRRAPGRGHLMSFAFGLTPLSQRAKRRADLRRPV
jgi:hypothetical protein